MNDFYRRKLPHWHPEGQIFFITFRLAKSLPVQIIHELQDELEREQQNIRTKFSGSQLRDELYKLDKKYFGRFDKWLDRCVEESPRWMRDDIVSLSIASCPIMFIWSLTQPNITSSHRI